MVLCTCRVISLMSMPLKEKEKRQETDMIKRTGTLCGSSCNGNVSLPGDRAAENNKSSSTQLITNFHVQVLKETHLIGLMLGFSAVDPYLQLTLKPVEGLQISLGNKGN